MDINLVDKEINNLMQYHINMKDKEKPLSKNEIGFRNYLKKFHPNKYIEYIANYYFI